MTLAQGASRVMAVIVLSASGCSQTTAPSTPPLEFVTTEADVGIVYHDESIRHEFRFRVWDRGPVRIEHASTTCCGPNRIDPDLTGVELHPGTEHTLAVTMPASSRREKATVVALIETSPPTAEPLTLRLHAIRAPPPVVHPAPVVLESVLPDVPVATVTVSRRRTSDAAPLQLDFSRCDVSPLEITDVHSTTKRVGNPHTMGGHFVDVITFTLVPSTADVIDGERHTIRLAWTDKLPKSLVPVVVQRRHPLQPGLRRVFCGQLGPGEVWSYELPLRRLRRGVRVTSVVSESEFVSGTYDDAADVIRLIAHGDGESEGRFDVALTITYDEPSSPPVVVRVSGTWTK